MSDREKFLQELDQVRSDEELQLARASGLRPWFARPAVWLGGMALGGFLLVLVAWFLRAAPGP